MKLVLAILLVVINAFAIPQLINYQGQLASPTGTPLDTTVAMTFRLYPVPVGGALSWTESHPSVIVSDGLFNVLLGSVSTLPDQFAVDRWLGITVGNNTEMTPRQRISSVAQAYRVGTVDGASGGTVSSDVVINGKINVGSSNSNSGAFAMVLGQNNLASGSNTMVGGRYNLARGDYSVVAGGGGSSAADSNSASGRYAVVGGGGKNSASGLMATIGGGYGNWAVDTIATIAGGQLNTAQGWASSVGGGYDNNANSDVGTVAGGLSNIAGGYGASVGGGAYNTAPGDYSVIDGGNGGRAIGVYSAVGGGWENEASGLRSVVGGGMYNLASDTNTTVGGGSYNTANGYGGAVCGGVNNAAHGEMGFVGGGGGNGSWGNFASVAGGSNNNAWADYAYIGGGVNNTASGQESAVIGGFANAASGQGSAVIGGYNNTASGLRSSVLGGQDNSATGDYSCAFGRNAHAIHPGSFVWSDGWGTNLTSSANDQFSVRASGGFRFYTNVAQTSFAYLAPGSGSWVELSDSTKKRDIRLGDTKAVLDKIAALPIKEWEYKSEAEGIEHIGPMAQDFWNAFHLGSDSLGISTIDADGVLFAAVQELARQNSELRAMVEELMAEKRK